MVEPGDVIGGYRLLGVIGRGRLQGDSAKVADFGIAHYAFSDVTQIMGLLGSPRYLSPEQAREEELSPSTDLYSLGVVLYELLSGHPPSSPPGCERAAAGRPAGLC